MIVAKAKDFLITAGQWSVSIFAGLNHLLWPALCGICDGSVPETADGLCRSCWGELMRCTGGDHCPRCGKDASKYAVIDAGCAKCQDRDIHFDQIARAGVYDSPLRDIILAFKFNDRTEFDNLLCLLAESALKGSGLLNRTEIFVPVPLHWKRRLSRGYNQSLIICKGMNVAPAKISTDLVRVRHTRRQWKLSPAKRKSNVAGAFAVRKGHKFEGRTVCLVDDIITTGATLNECAKTLKQAGAKKVFALVVAASPRDADT